MKLMKRIGAYVLTAALILGAIPVSYIAAQAGENYTGRLWLGASRANASHECSATCLHMTGTDKLLAASGEINAVLIPNDDNSGIWLDGEKTGAMWLLKYHGSNCSYMIGGLGDITATEGTTIVLEGTFKCQDQTTYSTDTVTFEKSTFVYNGTKWMETVETESSATLTLGAGSTENGIYVNPTANVFVADNYGWVAKAYPVRDGSSGVYVNGTWVNVPMFLLVDTTYYLGLADAQITATEGTTVVVRGKFGQDTQVVDFAQICFRYDGSAWSVVQDVNYSVTLSQSTVQASDAKNIYFDGTPDNALEASETIAYTAATAESGIFLNDVKQDSAVIKKVATGGNTYYCVGLSDDASENDILTIKAFSRFTHVGTNSGITVSNEIKLKYTASGWVNATETSAAAEFQISALTGSTFVDAQDMWHLYFGTNAALPGKAWNDMSGFQVSVNDSEAQPIASFTDGNGAIGFYLSSSLLPKEVTSDYKIVIKAGEATGVDGTKYKLTTDFALYVNERGWSVEGFIKDPVYKQFTFTGYVAPSGYNSTGDRWDFYLTPSAELPGEVDTSDYFTGIKAKVQVGNETEKEAELMLFRVSHQNSIWFPIYTTTLPADAAETGFKVTILAGKADSTNDTIDGVELTEDFTLYVNQYGWSTTDYVKAPVYDKVTFTGLFGDRTPNFIEGEYESGWHLYLNPSVMLPGQNDDATQFADVEVTVDDGTPETFTRTMVHSSNEGTAWMLIPDSQLAKDITTNTKIIIKAGKYNSNNDYNGIEIAEDYVIYANKYGWSTEGFVEAPAYTSLSFTGMNAATGYNGRADVNAWDFYLTPSVNLPGKADSSLFKGIQMSVNDGEKFDINIVKSAHANTAFIRVSTNRIPKSITSNTKIVIHAGEALCEEDNIGIKLTKDFVIYANKYGMSTTGYESAPTLKESGIKVAIDRYAAYGGTEDGIYLTTTDHFPVDTSWGTRIRALGYDTNSGVFLNGEKLDSAGLIRYLDGKLYISLSDIGVKAKDHDKLTVKGTFALGSYAVSYAEKSFYFNGKIWNDKYEAPKAETYKKINITAINAATTFIASQKQWNLYFDVDTMLPGEIDQMHFYNVTLQIGSKTIETWAAHSYNHTLYVPISETDLPQNCPDGTQITLKAGKALGTDKSSGIEIAKDFTIYTYKGSVFTEKPTTDTDWQEITIQKLMRSGNYNKEAEMWQLFLKLPEALDTEVGTKYLQFPLYIDGKEILVTAYQEDGCFYISIPASVVPGDTKSATITIKAVTKATANAGKNGVIIKEEYNCYLFNGAISDTKYTEVEKTELNFTGLQAVTQDPTMAHVYIKTNKEFPGTTWYEYYNDFVYYYNGREMETYACKPNSSNNKLFYFPIGTTILGLPKEGDIIEIKPSEVVTCGGYEVTILNGFKMIYQEGVWSEYVEADVEKPADIGSLWSIARFNENYIPVQDEKGVLFSGEDEYPEILSTEKLKDYTISFTSRKAYDDEIANTFKVVMRGNAISENEAMSPTLLYGYVITFSPMEIPNPENPDEYVWSGYLELWKNGENMALTDQYRLAYAHERYDNPFFKYDEEYEYEFSIYNVTETCVCIEARVNDKLIMRYYDEASTDPFDPAVNAGTFGLYATGPNYIKDDVVELDAVIAEKEECVTGEEVRVAATYPSVIKDAEFTVDKKGATVEDGVFVAEKAGTYTISCKYKGKELTAKTITVSKAETVETEGGEFPVVPVVIGGVSALLIAGAVVFLVLKKKKKQSAE